MSDEQSLAKSAVQVQFDKDMKVTALWLTPELCQKISKAFHTQPNLVTLKMMPIPVNQLIQCVNEGDKPPRPCDVEIRIVPEPKKPKGQLP